MEMKGPDYSVSFEKESSTVFFKGIFRLTGDEYATLSSALTGIAGDAAKGSGKLTLDMSALEFLNSAGINVFLKFVLAARASGPAALSVKGNSKIPWQTKSLSNLKKLNPDITLAFD
jgi:hypothetical protein